MSKMKKLMVTLLCCLLVLSVVFSFEATETEAASKQISDISKKSSAYKAAQWTIDNDYMQ